MSGIAELLEHLGADAVGVGEPSGVARDVVEGEEGLEEEGVVVKERRKRILNFEF